MGTLHRINKNNPAIIAELEMATGRMAVITGNGIVLLKIPRFRNQKKKQFPRMINVSMPSMVPFIELAKFAARIGCRVEYDHDGNAKFVPASTGGRGHGN